MSNGMIRIGPAGADGEQSWDHKGYTGIDQIFISHEQGLINSLQFQYIVNDRSVFPDQYGSPKGTKFNTVKLDYPSEYITWIRGHNNAPNGRITSLTFGTNKRQYGPFGGAGSDDREFHFELGEDRQFGGFFGTTDNHSIMSIGVYLKPLKIVTFEEYVDDIIEQMDMKELDSCYP